MKYTFLWGAFETLIMDNWVWDIACSCWTNQCCLFICLFGVIMQIYIEMVSMKAAECRITVRVI